MLKCAVFAMQIYNINPNAAILFSYFAISTLQNTMSDYFITIVLQKNNRIDTGFFLFIAEIKEDSLNFAILNYNITHKMTMSKPKLKIMLRI